MLTQAIRLHQLFLAKKTLRILNKIVENGQTVLPQYDLLHRNLSTASIEEVGTLSIPSSQNENEQHKVSSARKEALSTSTAASCARIIAAGHQLSPNSTLCSPNVTLTPVAECEPNETCAKEQYSVAAKASFAALIAAGQQLSPDNSTQDTRNTTTVFSISQHSLPLANGSAHMNRTQLRAQSSHFGGSSLDAPECNNASADAISSRSPNDGLSQIPLQQHRTVSTSPIYTRASFQITRIFRLRQLLRIAFRIRFSLVLRQILVQVARPKGSLTDEGGAKGNDEIDLMATSSASCTEEQKQSAQKATHKTGESVSAEEQKQNAQKAPHNAVEFVSTPAEEDAHSIGIVPHVTGQTVPKQEELCSMHIFDEPNTRLDTSNISRFSSESNDSTFHQRLIDLEYKLSAHLRLQRLRAFFSILQSKSRLLAQLRSRGLPCDPKQSGVSSSALLISSTPADQPCSNPTTASNSSLSSTNSSSSEADTSRPQIDSVSADRALKLIHTIFYHWKNGAHLLYFWLHLNSIIVTEIIAFFICFSVYFSVREPPTLPVFERFDS